MINLLRVLAVAPSTKGFGFAVMEEPNLLIDWGVKAVGGNKNARCVRLVSKLLDHYKPDVLVLEDCWIKGSQRRPRIQALVKELYTLATTKRVRTRSFSRYDIRRVFPSTGNPTKQQIAETVAGQFTELAIYLPHKRKPWMSEDYRMGIFDAMAFALTLLVNYKTDADISRRYSE
jgi:Holliday junction resolvasome RuvABC endonuclease subunit